jgi:hypothetical protein
MANVVDKIRELQDEIRERFGVEAQINISIYDDTINPAMTKCLAEHIADEIASQVDSGDICDHRHGKGETYQWVRLDTSKNFTVNAFYPEEEIQDETLRTRD